MTRWVNSTPLLLKFSSSRQVPNLATYSYYISLFFFFLNSFSDLFIDGSFPYGTEHFSISLASLPASTQVNRLRYWVTFVLAYLPFSQSRYVSVG